jgi:hypothetical protein
MNHNGEFYLLGYVGEGAINKLPESCGGARYSIYYYAFTDADFENGTLYIPDTVWRIYPYAMAYNTNLKIVFGGEGIEEIGSKSFYQCSELMSFTLGVKLKNIYTDAFSGCNKLYDLINHSSLKVEKGTTSYSWVAFYAINVITDPTVSDPGIFIDDEFAFYFRDNLCYLVGYYGDGDDDVPGQLTLPDSFANYNYGVYKRAIGAIEGVTKIRLSSAVTSIWEGAFGYNVDEIYIPDLSHLERIEDKAFKNTSITEIFLPSSLLYIGKNAFPETLEKAEFANTANWKTEGLFGMDTVKPTMIEDPKKAAEYLSNPTRYLVKDVEE